MAETETERRGGDGEERTGDSDRSQAESGVFFFLICCLLSIFFGIAEPAERSGANFFSYLFVDC